MIGWEKDPAKVFKIKNFALKPMKFALKTMKFCIENAEVFISNDELCIKTKDPTEYVGKPIREFRSYQRDLSKRSIKEIYQSRGMCIYTFNPVLSKRSINRAACVYTRLIRSYQTLACISLLNPLHRLHRGRRVLVQGRGEGRSNAEPGEFDLKTRMNLHQK